MGNTFDQTGAGVARAFEDAGNVCGHGAEYDRIAKSADQPRVGSVLVAGRPQFWSWVVIDEVDDDIAYFHQVSARQAASIGPLVAGVPTAV